MPDWVNLTQEELDKLEKKSFEIEIKAVDNDGTFKGPASPFNNVDYGNDKVMPSIAKRNEGKRVPMLVQHMAGTEIGEIVLKKGDNAMMAEGKFYLETLENGDPIFPDAHRAYVLAKKGLLKLSIGYRTHKFKYDSKGVRELQDIEIMEVSRVTFPMNPKAKVSASEVKNAPTNGEKGAKSMEEKAMSFSEIISRRENGRKMNMVMNAFHESIGALLHDQDTPPEEKLKMLDQNISDFSTMFKEAVASLIESGSKEIDFELETKAKDKEKKGDRLAARLRRAMEADERDSGEIVSAIASAANIDEDTVNAILAGRVIRPPDQRLRAFARVLNVSFEELRRLADQDQGKSFDISELEGKATKAQLKTAMAVIKALIGEEEPKGDMEDEEKSESFKLELKHFTVKEEN